MRRQKIEDIHLDALHVPNRLRSVTPERVAALASSIKEIGLQTPISVVYRDQVEHEGETVDGMYVLVAGATRLRAAESLGWEKITAFILDADDLEAQLWEVDENLCRTELTDSEVAEHSTKRKALWAAIKLRQCGGASCATSLLGDGRRAGPQHQKSFAADTAEKTGKSKATINRALSRGKNIAPDVLQSVKGTTLDKGVELDALAKKPHEEQRRIVEQVRAGKQESARVPVDRFEEDMNTVADRDMARILKAYTVSQFQEWFDRIQERAPELIKRRLAA